MQVPVMSHTLLKQSPGGPASKLFRPKGQQKQSEGEEAQRSCSSSSDMLSSPVAWSGLRCLVPLYSSANQTWFHEDSSYKAPSSGHSGNYYIFGLDCWEFCFFMILSFLLFFFCSNESECSPLSVLLVCCAFLSFSFNTAEKKKKDKKPFLFKLQERLLSNSLYKEVSSHFHLPVSFTMFLVTWWCPFFYGVHWHPSWGNMLPVWPCPWAVPALANVSFSYQVCCHPVLSQDSGVLFIFVFNSSDFSELQLERNGLVPRSSVTEHLAKVLLSEVTLMFCLR